MKTRHGFEATSIAHKIEIENNGDSLAMMTAIEAMSSESITEDHDLVVMEDQDWGEETSTYYFNDGSSLVFSGPDVQRIEPVKEV